MIKSFTSRRAISLFVALAMAFGVSYLGVPPPRHHEKRAVPINLEQRDKTGYSTRDFGFMEIYHSGSNIPLCRIASTTAVRNYFDNSGEYKERTRIEQEVCQLPTGTSLDVKVTLPYKPIGESVQHNLDSLSSFSNSAKGWRASGNLMMSGYRHNLTLTAYEEQKNQNNTPSDEHQKNADRFDILVMQK